MLDERFNQTKEALAAAGVTGRHQSHSRANTVDKARAMVEHDVEARFGIAGVERYTAGEVLGFLAELTGCSPDLESLEGEDTVDPARTVQAIVGAGRRLREEALRGSSLLATTGHPTGLLEHHMRVAEAFREAGGKLVRLREDEKLTAMDRKGEIRYVGTVGCLSNGASLLHTHSSRPMELVLEAGPWPDVVLGDHGFAGAAIERGIPTIAVMDINDPALAVAWAEQRDVVVIPMDDNRPPYLYEPSWQLFQALIRGEDVAGTEG